MYHPTSTGHGVSSHDAEVQRNAYNVAFTDLGLSWFWDAATHRSLPRGADERDTIRVYIETRQAHLLKAYDAEFLVNAIHATKQRRLEALGV